MSTETHHVTGTYKMSNDRAPDWMPRGSNAWIVQLRYRGRRMTLPFYTGPALTSFTVDDVLDNLLIGTDTLEETFEQWAEECGYDTDSRRAQEIYEACKRQSKKLARLLGEDFEEIRYLDYDERRTTISGEWS